MTALSGDSDNDGLKDWEEVIYKTDPKNADSDGDGSFDGDEIKLGRNPLVPGPSDSIAKPIADTASQEPVVLDTFTEQFASKLLSTDVFSSLLQTGNAALSEEEAAALARQLAEEGAKFLSVNEDGLFVSIKIASKGTLTEEQLMQKYLNELGSIQLTYLTYSADSPEQDPSSIIAEATKTKDSKKFAELKKYVSLIDTAMARMLLLPVPISLLDVHKKELVLLAKNKKSLSALANIQKDPLAAIAALNSYLSLRKEGSDIRREISSLIEKNRLLFSDTEDGYFFVLTRS
ncbi:MAG: hypothetical protein HYW88_01395 [Candidatus Sungbacteria bacterium]|nr:hypothetical protein [Candidatus Sungbacteria bacterium]